jgi:hypothetical protein
MPSGNPVFVQFRHLQLKVVGQQLLRVLLFRSRFEEQRVVGLTEEEHPIPKDSDKFGGRGSNLRPAEALAALQNYLDVQLASGNFKTFETKFI